ncbi:DNA repair protein RecN [Edaphobacillus lindanitolerans]|uniref:DNA repair protein RecN n=1 Tax=Edaphobacillus lindanitolerans TaxID=550447 RepID=A0A1U7PPT3_9BACI|nr:DNA repair protein RecN [Edaphobacillus lindanitolerans]SIT81635.1 DNA replication and repair protein RecN [Edaphobacillus lindanitolerans]
MLRELSIKNFAIISELSISFDAGLTVLTGETGAGKSIIIDAVQLLAGGRGSSEFIRHGEKKAELEGMFVLDNPDHPVFRKLEDNGILHEEGAVILRRDISQSGKSTCRINGKLVTIAILREIGASIIDIHGQHETQELMDEQRHVLLLDQFGGEAIAPAKDSYTKLYDRYVKLRRRLAQYEDSEQQIAHKIDLYRFQLGEIDDAGFQEQEEEELTEERTRLKNFHTIYERVASAYEAIQGESKGLDWTGAAMSDLEHAASVDPAVGEQSTAVSDAFYTLQDAAFSLKSLLDEMEFDPVRLEEVEQRLALLQSMKRKYGATVPDILSYRDRIAAELEKLENRDERLQHDREEIEALEEDLQVEAEELSVLRRRASEQLSEAIHRQLKELYMEKAEFSVSFNPRGRFDRDGAEDVTFLISANVGEPLKPLAKVASGGELSRIMLALKSIFSKHQEVTSIIFDEVDTGVSGRVAQAIAEKIAAISIHSQVLCISHLPQVAAMADHHLLIRKDVKGERTTTTVLELEGFGRTEELSRMMTGTEMTELTKQHADELLRMASERKTELAGHAQ